MRVVILTNPQSNQNALITKMAERVDVAAVVLSQNIPRKKPAFAKRIRSYANAFAARSAGRELLHAWQGMLQRYEESFPAFTAAPIVKVENINDDETRDAVSKYAPDLIVVSGTNLVGRKLIEHSKDFGGIVNLHTGVSPYVKGGPNCTNWCLAKAWFHLIGNTVMWLDAGVDSGALIATERTPLDGSESLTDLQWKVMEHAHDLYVSVVEQHGQKKELPSVSQSSIADGTEFRSAEWNARAMKSALSNFKTAYRDFFRNFEPENLPKEIKLLPLDRG